MGSSTLTVEQYNLSIILNSADDIDGIVEQLQSRVEGAHTDYRLMDTEMFRIEQDKKKCDTEITTLEQHRTTVEDRLSHHQVNVETVQQETESKQLREELVTSTTASLRSVNDEIIGKKCKKRKLEIKESEFEKQAKRYRHAYDRIVRMKKYLLDSKAELATRVPCRLRTDQEPNWYNDIVPVVIEKLNGELIQRVCLWD